MGWAYIALTWFALMVLFLIFFGSLKYGLSFRAYWYSIFHRARKDIILKTIFEISDSDNDRFGIEIAYELPDNSPLLYRFTQFVVRSDSFPLSMRPVYYMDGVYALYLGRNKGIGTHSLPENTVRLLPSGTFQLWFPDPLVRHAVFLELQDERAWLFALYHWYSFPTSISFNV